MISKLWCKLMRTFIAIDIDDENLVTRIIEIERTLKASGAHLKLVEPENLHITLKFLGEIDPKDLDIILDVVRKYSQEEHPFEIKLKGIGAFPSMKAPRVVWIGIDKNREKIISLATKISEALEKLGFRKEEREFHPHITIARVKRFNASLKNFINANQDIEIGEYYVRSIRIKKSTLTPHGPIYTTLSEIPLPEK